MESKKNIIAYLRQKQGLTQEELAEKLFVTRQAVSRWETGETTPNADILLRLSMLFGVSVNALLTLPSEWSEVHPKTMTEFQLRDRILQEFNDLNILGQRK